jgi:hypothetical protein
LHIRRAHRSEASVLAALALDAKSHWAYAPEDLENWRSQIAVSDEDVKLNPTFVAEIDQGLLVSTVS